MEDGKSSAKKKCTDTQDFTSKMQMLESKLDELLQRMSALENKSMCQCQCKTESQAPKATIGKEPPTVDRQNSCQPIDQLEKLCNAIEANTWVHEGRLEDKNMLQTLTLWPVLKN